MDADCPHLIPDENNKCEDCGAPYPESENLPEPNLGNIIAISKLIDETRRDFDKIIKANTDPLNPKLPKMRIVGGQIMRLPHKMVIQAMVGPSFIKAKTFGYRGTQSRWVEMVLEEIPTQCATPIL